MIGFHFQRPVPDWPRAVAALPAGAPVKAIDNVQLLSEAKAHNAGVYTILRHWYDGVGIGGQHFNGSADWQDYQEAASVFLAAFVDGTFAQHAANVDAIEGWNEYHATGMSAADIATRTAWARALCETWAAVYVDTYPHIDLIIANTAIGNDIPASIAQLSQLFSFVVVGYHPYVPITRTGAAPESLVPEVATSGASMREGTTYYPQSGYRSPAQPEAASNTNGPLPGEWQYYSGRWAVMDEAWRAQGIRVRWAFTEAGPVGMTPTGGLDAINGWRAGHVFGGDVQRYIDNLRYFCDNVARTRAYQEGRVKGAVLFTTNEFGHPWGTFETRQPEMDAIAAFARQWVADNPPGTPPPPPPEPPPPVEERRYSRTYYLLPQSATTEQAQRVMSEAWASKSTVGGSADDAFVNPPEVTRRRVIVYDVDAIAGSAAALEGWVSTHYGMDGLTIEYREFGFNFAGLNFGPPFRERYVLTSPFDATRDYGRHEGADYDVTTTTALVDVLAMHGGKVIRSEDTQKGYGQLVVLESQVDGQVYRTWYAHLSNRYVEVGQRVERGQAIGKLGSTGNSSGAHVHINLQIPGHGRSGYVVADVVDPAPWVPDGDPPPMNDNEYYRE